MRSSRIFVFAPALALLSACLAGNADENESDTDEPSPSELGGAAGGRVGTEDPARAGHGGAPAMTPAGHGGIAGEGPGSGGDAAGERGGAAGDDTAPLAGAGGLAPPPPGAVAPADGDRTIGPAYTRARETRPTAGYPTGRLLPFVLSGATSKLLPGTYLRKCAIYVPAQYMKGTPASFIVLQDGGYPFNQIGALQNTLDTLIHERKLPPTVAIFAGNRDSKDAESQRQSEYNTMSTRYGDWVERELLPAAEAESVKQLPEQAVTLSRNPAHAAAMGCSSGGTGALNMAWFRPDRFGRAAAFSASFLHASSNFAGVINGTSPNKPIRVWLEVGAGETKYLDVNRRVASAFRQKKYSYHFDLAQGGGHCALQVVYQTLPELVLWLFRD